MPSPYHSDSLDTVKRFANGMLYASASDLLERGMETNEARRRRRLELLIKRGKSLEEIAEAAGMSAAYLDQIIKGTKLPAKKDGTRSVRNLADDAARRIEAGLELGIGWLDWPLELIEPSAYYSLSEFERGAFEIKFRDALNASMAPSQKLASGF